MDLSKGIYRGDDFKRNYDVNYETLNLLTFEKTLVQLMSSLATAIFNLAL
jgi:hypothetical protein